MIHCPLHKTSHHFSETMGMKRPKEHFFAFHLSILTSCPTSRRWLGEGGVRDILQYLLDGVEVPHVKLFESSIESLKAPRLSSQPTFCVSYLSSHMPPSMRFLAHLTLNKGAVSQALTENPASPTALKGVVLRIVCVLCTKLCAGPYPSCIVVPSTSSEPCYALYALLACLSLISSAFVCVVVHVT